jgi:hypothetical protein
VSYRQIITLCQQLGAQTTGQIHKRVHALIATPSAVGGGGTQRVRKALKKDLPIISTQWLYDCRRQVQCIDWSSYRLMVVPDPARQSAAVVEGQDEEARDTTTTATKRCKRSFQRHNNQEIASMDTKGKETTSMVVKTISLGCCCACHDNEEATMISKSGVRVPTDCPWCVDCDVNQAAAAAVAVAK